MLVGVLATPLLIDVIAYGFHGAKRELTIRLVRILFPGAGFLVMSAWCLGNTEQPSAILPFLQRAGVVELHHYWALLWFGPRSGEDRIAFVISWASVIGSAVQFLVQLPVVLQLVPALRIALAIHLPNVRVVIGNFGPVFLSRGVVQISAFIDSMLASPLPGGVAMLGYVTTISGLPVSLFGMSVSASELPEMSRATGDDAERAAYLRKRLIGGLRRITFLVIPSVVGFLLLGDEIIGLVFQSGKFTVSDTVWGWGILAGSAVGLLASTQGRLYSSAFYALKDTRTPLRFAIIRICLTTALGYLSVRHLPMWIGIDARWGIAGLTASAGVAGWVEFILLRRALGQRIGSEPVGTGIWLGFGLRLWGRRGWLGGLSWRCLLWHTLTCRLWPL